jgi:hypothetical protein
MKAAIKKKLEAMVGDIEKFQTLLQTSEIVSLYNRLVLLLDEDHELKGLTDTYDELDGIADEERDYYEEKSDRWKEGDNGEAYLEVVDRLENARDGLDSVRDYFESLNVETMSELDERFESLEEVRGELLTLIQDY